MSGFETTCTLVFSPEGDVKIKSLDLIRCSSVFKKNEVFLKAPVTNSVLTDLRQISHMTVYYRDLSKYSQQTILSSDVYYVYMPIISQFWRKIASWEQQKLFNITIVYFSD